MKLLAAFVVVLLGIFVMAYMQLFSESARMKTAVEQKLTALSATTATKDREKIVAELSDFFTDDAQIKLDVDFVSIVQQGQHSLAQDFDKPQFKAFMDNVIYSLSDYAFTATPQLKHFEPSGDKHSANILMTSVAWGDSVSGSYYANVPVTMRYLLDTDCQGEVRYAEKQAKFSKLDCKIQVHPMPHAVAGSGQEVDPKEILNRATQ